MAKPNDRLERLINLINKTGDKLIVFDQVEPDNCYVISSLSDYENMAIAANGVKGLTEDELIDRINRDIAIWKEGQNTYVSHDFEEHLQRVPSPENLPMHEPQNSAGKTQRPKGNPWKIPESRLREAEEIITEDKRFTEETPL